MKDYQAIYKFSDVIETIEAKSLEEAKKIANERLMSDYNPQNDVICYDIEVEEVKDDE